MFMQDINSTRSTPVNLGSPDKAIYGKGFKIRPRIDGRKDTEHFRMLKSAFTG